MQRNWADIATAPENKWVLVRGGWQPIRWGKREDTPVADIGPAVVARKDPAEKHWYVGDSDADFAASSTIVEYAEPTQWMDIPGDDNAA